LRTEDKALVLESERMAFGTGYSRGLMELRRVSGIRCFGE
jgi:hypothetical protein